jgi:hypothetical protein
MKQLSFKWITRSLERKKKYAIIELSQRDSAGRRRVMRLKSLLSSVCIVGTFLSTITDTDAALLTEAALAKFAVWHVPGLYGI